MICSLASRTEKPNNLALKKVFFKVLWRKKVVKIDQNGFWPFIRPSLGLRKKYLISLAQDTQNFNLASLKCFHISCRGHMIHSEIPIHLNLSYYIQKVGSNSRKIFYLQQYTSLDYIKNCSPFYQQIRTGGFW